MLNKKAYSVQMNFTVPDSEKRIAEKAEEHFEQLLTLLTEAATYLDLIYIPFNKYQNVDMDMIVEYRKTFRDYRNHVKRKFDKILDNSYKCISLMNTFDMDTSTSELMDSFIASIRELEKYIETFVSIFSNLNNQEFRNYIISTIDSIKKQINQIEQLIKDRILDHIDTNILAKNWADKNTNDELISERVPLVVQLFRERQKALTDSSE